MGAVFFGAILPIFALAALGFILARASLFDARHASAINKFVFYVSLPSLLFLLVATTSLADFQTSLITAYVAIELGLYAAGFLLVRLIFMKSWQESLLIGMACAFPNHVYFVLPIAVQLYGEAATLPIVALITVDAILLFGGTVLILDAGQHLAEKASPLRVILKLSKNPQILALGLGLAINLLAVPIPEGIETFASFAGNAAAPASLFALGVILYLQPSGREFALPLSVTLTKIAIMPLLVWAALSHIAEPGSSWAGPTMLVAAGPAGAMPFVLALQYKVPSETIATVILWATLGSLVTLTVISQFAMP